MSLFVIVSRNFVLNSEKSWKIVDLSLILAILQYFAVFRDKSVWKCLLIKKNKKRKTTKKEEMVTSGIKFTIKWAICQLFTIILKFFENFNGGRIFKYQGAVCEISTFFPSENGFGLDSQNVGESIFQQSSGVAAKMSPLLPTAEYF